MITLIKGSPVMKVAADATFSNAGEVYAYLHATYADPMGTADYVLGPVRLVRFSQSVYYKGYSVNFPWQASSFFAFAHHVPGTDVMQYDMAEGGFVYVWNAVLPGTDKKILAVGWDNEYDDSMVVDAHFIDRIEMLASWTFNPETVLDMIRE